MACDPLHHRHEPRECGVVFDIPSDVDASSKEPGTAQQALDHTEVRSVECDRWP